MHMNSHCEPFRHFDDIVAYVDRNNRNFNKHTTSHNIHNTNIDIHHHRTHKYGDVIVFVYYNTAVVDNYWLAKQILGITTNSFIW